MPEFIELFKVEYTGTVGELVEAIGEIQGVESASTNKRNHMQVDNTLDFEIRYDNHETDRTQLAQQIETLDGTDTVTFG